MGYGAVTKSAAGVSGSLAHVYTGLLGPDEFRIALRHAVASGRPGQPIALVLLDVGPAPAPRVVSAAARTLRSAAKGIGVAEWRGDPDCAEELLCSVAQAVGDAFAGRPHEPHGPAETLHAAQLSATYLATVRTLAAAVEAKDDHTGGHIQRVHDLGLLLAREVVPEEADDEQLAYGFLLHDVGKLAVPDAVLTKPGRLTGGEWELMRSHPREGARILAGIPFLGRALHIVLYHHERWDGGGYPHGLKGEEIPRWARLFAVVDTVDAMTSDRPYRAALDSRRRRRRAARPGRQAVRPALRRRLRAPRPRRGPVRHAAPRRAQCAMMSGGRLPWQRF